MRTAKWAHPCHQAGVEVITICNRRNVPVRLSAEDFAIQQARVPRRARFIYMLGDAADAEVMFAWVDAAADRAMGGEVSPGT